MSFANVRSAPHCPNSRVQCSHCDLQTSSSKWFPLSESEEASFKELLYADINSVCACCQWPWCSRVNAVWVSALLQKARRSPSLRSSSPNVCKNYSHTKVKMRCVHAKHLNKRVYTDEHTFKALRQKWRSSTHDAKIGTKLGFTSLQASCDYNKYNIANCHT